MITRKDYMAGIASHHAYYIQFATAQTRAIVERAIGADRIKASSNKHFNDIPLAKWDCLNESIRSSIDRELFRLANNTYSGGSSVDGVAPKGSIYWSLSDAVCLAKAVASEIRGPVIGEPLTMTVFGSEVTFPALTRVKLIKGADAIKGDLWAVESVKLITELTGDAHDAKHRFVFVDSQYVWGA